MSLPPSDPQQWSSLRDRRTRRAQTLAISIGPTDQPILAALGRYCYLTAAQVTQLVYAPGSRTYAQARLKRLVDARLLARIILPRPTRTGSAPLVYTLTRRGLTTLAAWGRPLHRRYRPAEIRELSYLYLAHTLALNDVLIALEQLVRQMPGLTLAELRHERILKLQPVIVQLADGRRAGAIPDAWIDLRLSLTGPGSDSKQYQECYWLELDRGTTEQRAWRRKIAALVAAAQGPYQQAFGTASLTFAVVATPGEARAEQLRRWTEVELRQLDRLATGVLFRFTGAAVADHDPETFFRGAHWRTPGSSRSTPLLDLTTLTQPSDQYRETAPGDDVHAVSVMDSLDRLIGKEAGG